MKMLRVFAICHITLVSLSLAIEYFKTVNIDESTVIGNKIHQLPEPKDGFKYYIYESGDLEALALFHVEENGNIKLKAKLNYEVGKANSYFITSILRHVDSRYGGTAYTRKFQVVDSNNHSPVWSKEEMYVGEIEEELPAGSIVKGLEDCFATDLDSSGIKDYTITEGNNKKEFELFVKEVNGIKLLVVRTLRTIDRDSIRSMPYLDLGIQANDGGKGDQQRYAKQMIRIFIRDVNDNPPVFIHNNLQKVVQENGKIMTLVTRISASDNDEGVNSEIYYNFETPSDEFIINPSTGEIRIASTLDVSVKKDYQLDIIAKDKSPLESRSAKTSILIRVLDIPNFPPENDETGSMPKFLQNQYSVTVRGDLPVNSFVYLAAVDSAGLNSNFEYSLYGQDRNLFQISRKSGVILLAQQFNKAVKQKYHLNIRIRDSRGDTSTATLVINVQPYDLNLNDPMFYPSTVSVDISEDLNINSEIGVTAQASDKDSGKNAELTYHILSGSGIGRFRVDKRSGKITTNVVFKTPDVYNLLIVAQDSGEYKRSGKMYLQVNVKPSFRSAPITSQSIYTASIPEALKKDSFVGAIFAKSPGEDRSVTYEKTGDNPPIGLALDRETGVITTTLELDYEQDESLFMEITVRVQGISQVTKTALQAEIININDNHPEFPRSSITVHVKENSGNVDSLLCLFATDRDGMDLQYSIVSGNIGNMFSINSETGQLSSKNLDYETHRVYKLEVLATDGLYNAKATVNVVVKDSNDPPYFDQAQFTADLEESAHENTVVKSLGITSEASGSHTCVWGVDNVTPEILSMFSLHTDPKACIVKVRSKDKIVWTPEQSVYTFDVRALYVNNKNEHSTTTVIVSILDINNHKPEFSQESYAVTVIGAVLLEKSILQVKASDGDYKANGQITFDIQEGVDSNLFVIEPSGDIKVKSTLDVNKEFSLVVNARNQGKTTFKTSTIVKISVVDEDRERPEIVELAKPIIIPENLAQDSKIAQLYTKKGGSTFEIVGGNTNKAFQVSTNGLMTVKDLLDYEAIKKYLLVVRATTTSLPPRYVEKTIEVSIEDVNDNAPKFAVENPNIPEDVYIDQFSPEGTVVAKYKAFDEDWGVNGEVAYAILENVPFTVDSDGSITTTREIDDAMGSKFTFTLRASDKSKTTVQSVKLRINAEVKFGLKLPVFNQKLYKSSLTDNVPIGKSVGTISTTDTDLLSTATFQVSSGDLDDTFCIDYTKTLFTQKSLDYDLTKNSQILLSVEMTQGYQKSKTNIIITMADENDNPPEFVNGIGPIIKEISEAVSVGAEVYVAEAEDKDSGENGRITYSISQTINKCESSGHFDIDADSGKVTVAQSLNYEECTEHMVIVKATDNGENTKKFTLQKLKIEVLDENDEIPTFTESIYSAHVLINSEPGIQVKQVYAADFDSGRFGNVEYSIIGDDYSGTFSIGESTGVISLRRPIALLSSREFTLKLKARDVSNEGQSIVRIFAVVKEGPPKFPLNKYTFEVSERNNPNVEIGQTKAISLDLLTYSIERGNANKTFRIHHESGLIYSMATLDAETSTQHTIYVRATDLSERFVETTVEINVGNINDNVPVFRSAIDGVIESVVSRSLAKGQIIVESVDAYDADIGDTLTYRINSAEARGYFHIDAAGTIRSLRSLDNLALDTNVYQFEVSAVDSEGSESRVSIRVVLAIFHSEGQVSRSVSESQDVAVSFIKDLGNQYPSAAFRIVSPLLHPFEIDQELGYIRLKQGLDYESTKQYSLIVQEENLEKRQQYINYNVLIRVTDANDNAPTFTIKDITAKVNKNAQPGTNVMQLSAVDYDSGDAGRISFIINDPDVPFSIDPMTSMIQTRAFYMTEDRYTFTVTALDLGNPSMSSPPIKITILTGANPPEFSKNLYQFEVEENSPSGKLIGKVHARSLSGIRIQYSVLSGDIDNVFTIDNQGQLILQGSVDFESGPVSYSLAVQASEISTKPLTATSNIIVQVKNMNDNRPQFTSNEYRSPSIVENVPIDSSLLTVSATDCDCNLNCGCPGGLLVYSIHMFTDTFKIDPVTGEIKNIRKLDYDTLTEYRFQVKVEDTGENSQTSLADVVVTLTNVNDNTPEFMPDHGVATIAENIPRGTIIVTVKAQDLDRDMLRYDIKSEDKSNFEIGEKSGVIKITTKSSPLFLKDVYILNVTAFDGVNTGYYALKVIIEDINDNSPVFKKCGGYKASVFEHADIHTTVDKIVALDSDRGRNGEVEYYIQEPTSLSVDASSDFEINNSTGVITTSKVFDREVKGSYFVLVVALDGGHGRAPAERNSATCQIEIEIEDINDHTPIFSVEKYDVSIAENSPINNLVLEVSAQDKDEGKNAEVTYSIEQSTLTPEFKIDTNTGVITVAQSLIGLQEKYSFQVVASDGGSPMKSTNTEVVIYVKPSNPPRFGSSSYNVQLKEDTTPGENVITVDAVSQTQGSEQKNIYYSIIPGNLPSTNKPPTFTVDSSTGNIKVGRVLDYETLNEYVLTLSAVDERGMKSNAKVYIRIQDVNDNSPLFVLSKYEFGKVAEGKRPGIAVEKVQATDDDSDYNGQVLYSLEPSPEAEQFSIDSKTGQIRTKVVFDREVTPKVTFNVKAEDQGREKQLHTVTYVTIQITDTNDNEPVFKESKYNRTVDENQKVDSKVVEIQAVDDDAGENSKLNYYIVSGNDDGFFGTKSVHRADGSSIGFVVVSEKLNREKADTFVLKIAASDSKYNAFTWVHIQVRDVNDNDPMFTQSIYNSTIVENCDAGVYVGTVEATDLDTPAVQDELTYSLSPEAEDYFIIDKKSGKISTGIKKFNREQKSMFNFVVYASDGTRVGSATMKVIVTDVNDEAPQFLDGPYRRMVQENQKKGAIVGYVTATDNDEGTNAILTYALSYDADRFIIDTNTGMIRTSRKLDRESEKFNKITVTVTATDGGETPMSGSVDVVILVTDANDQYPYFDKSVYKATMEECAPIGDPVITVGAKDNDEENTANTDLIFSIMSGNTPRRFRMDPGTGVITVAHRLDYEKEKSYKLYLSVRDKGLPQLIGKQNATVSVTVTDCNDNAPMFEMAMYTVDVLESENVGFVLLEVKANDVDVGNNGRIEFYLPEADETFYFRIQQKSSGEPNTAVLVLDFQLDREKMTQHVIKIAARDMGTPSKVGFSQVTVKVLDVNNNAPVFVPPDVCGQVKEETSGVQTVAVIEVTDADGVDNNCPCEFKIEDDRSNLFVLTRTDFGNKVIMKTRATARFDRDRPNQQLHKVLVSATDSGVPPMRSSTYVYVEVMDEKDNRLIGGGDLTINVNAHNGNFIGGDIGQVNIKDNDRVMSGYYDHSIIRSGNSNRATYFSIDDDGMIKADAGLPVGSYDLTVETKEKNRASPSVKSTVNVIVDKVPDVAVKNSLAIRMTGLRKKLTCNELAYPNFEELLAELLKVEKSQIKIFSAMKVHSLYRGVDIRFSVINKQDFVGYPDESIYYMSPMEINTILNRNRQVIEERTGGKVISIGIDSCGKETCTTGFCYNDVQPLTTYSIVTDENGIVPPADSVNTFISMDVKVVAVCLPDKKMISACKQNLANPCLNGGTCVSIIPSGYTCKCPKEFDGPQCQLTTRHVKLDGYFYLKPISFFYEGSISFEFSTKYKDGLILYHGPIADKAVNEVVDFLAVDLIDGKLRISVSQGEKKIFQRVLLNGKLLNDEVFHHVSIYKRGKYIRVVVDRCTDAEIVEKDAPVQMRDKCEISGTIPGKWRFVNGIYPLQIGGAKMYTIGATTLKFQSFHGCIRNIIDTGVMYDLNQPLVVKNSGTGCPAIQSKCPACGIAGICDLNTLSCVCTFGYQGRYCSLRSPVYRYLDNSYSRYVPMEGTKKRLLSWLDRYTTRYMLQVRTGGNGLLLYEGSDPEIVPMEESRLEIISNVLEYKYNLGDAPRTLSLPGVNITDNQWHNISVVRVGNHVTLEVWSDGQVVGSVTGNTGTHVLLDTNGVIYTGGMPDTTGFPKPTTQGPNNENDVLSDYTGCIAHTNYNNEELDGNMDYVMSVSRQNVDKNCSCTPAAVALCLNGGVCVPGSPPTCACAGGYQGSFCGLAGDAPRQGGSANTEGFNGMPILLVALLLFLGLMAALALFSTGVCRPKKPIPIYVDPTGPGNPKENVMVYYDEGAGEDDFHNYDLEKLLQHAGVANNLTIVDGSHTGAGGVSMEMKSMSSSRFAAGAASGFAAGGAGAASGFAAGGAGAASGFSAGGAAIGIAGAGGGKGEMEPLLHSESVYQNESRVETTTTSQFAASSSMQQQSSGFHANAQAEDLDLIRFIRTQLEAADGSDSAYPRDTLLHYGYEGEGSDMSDLSELGESESESEDEGDFDFLADWGPKFETLNLIYNPEGDDDV